MDNLLKRINPKVLLQIIGRDRVKKIVSILDNDNFHVDLVEIALAFFGPNILENKHLRKEIIKLLPDNLLKELSIKYYGKTYLSNESAAIQLSAITWSTSSKFPYDLIRYLNVSTQYLPQRNQRLNTVEIIQPVSTYFPLFDFQEEIQKKIVKYIIKEVPRFIVQMPTGSGKTKTCLEAVVNYNTTNNIIENGLSFVWVAHTEELCEQAIASLKTIWQNTQTSSLRIIRFWGGYEPTEDELSGSFIFSSYQKLCSKKNNLYLKLMSRSCKVVVIDEAHKALARTYSKMLNDLCSHNACLVGLTATPGRSFMDKLNNSDFAQFFNRQLITPSFKKNPILALRERKVLSSIEHITIESQIDLQSPEDMAIYEQPDFSLKQLSLLGMNSNRNKLIVDIIKNEIDSGNPCLVFSCSVEHSVILTGVLKFLGIRAAYVDSSIKKSNRRNIIADFKDERYDVLLNFGVLTTGFDAPRIKTVIISRPTTSIVLYSQMIGRGLRGSKMGGNDSCRVIDIKDNYQDFGPIENIYNFFSGYWN